MRSGHKRSASTRLPQHDRILGFTMIGPEAGEVMAVVQMAMLAGMPHSASSSPLYRRATRLDLGD